MRHLAQKKVGIVGCGNMGGAILDTLMFHKMMTPKRIVIFDKEHKKCIKYKKKYGVIVASTFEEFVSGSDIIILAVKPQNIEAVARNAHKHLFKHKLIISILAGVTLARLSKFFGRGVKIIRCMPNVGITVGCGVSALCKNSFASGRDLAIAEHIFKCCGITVRLAEKYINAVTALSGSGPAYYFYLTELLINEAVKNGIPRKESELLTKKTAEGAIRLIRKSKASPLELRRKVTSPGGTTEAAFTIFLSAQYKRLFSRAVSKAIRRAHSLSK